MPGDDFKGWAVEISGLSLAAKYREDGHVVVRQAVLFATKRQLKYQEHDGVRVYRNQPDDSPWNRVKFKLKTTACIYPVIHESLRKARDMLNQVRGA